MPLVTFVILHYMTFDITVNCINSIKGNIMYDNYRIVIVDNGSNNNSGEELKDLYNNESNIFVICLKKNKGFSVGNNIGYVYAKKRLISDYVIIINNDTEITQKNFVQKVIECFKSTSYYILGPDIVTLDGRHQNPLQLYAPTKRNVRKWLMHEKCANVYFHIHKLLHLPNKILSVASKQTGKNLKYDMIIENVPLQGACFVFSPLYIAENDYAFEELTFMYGEELLLFIRCKKNNWKTIYFPEIQINHIEQAATRSLKQQVIDKKIFCSNYTLMAIKEILKRV